MSKKLMVTAGSLAVLGLSGLAVSVPAQAAGFGDFMNPSKWFGKDRDRDYYYDRGYYGRGPYGYGYPGYGYGYPGYGYGYPGWGYGAPGYGYPAQSGGSTTQAPPPPPQ